MSKNGSQDLAVGLCCWVFVSVVELLQTPAEFLELLYFR